MSKEKEVVLELDNVFRMHGGRRQVDHCSCTLYAGEIVGLVGPNSAGKTMLIRMILRHLRAQEGSIKICGEDIEKRGPHSKGRVSAVLENPSYYRYMTGLDHLKMATRPYKDINVEMIREVVDRTGLKTCIRDKVATYTSKQRYMLAVAQALVTQPALLLLDEPTDDLDPVGIKNLREILKEEATKGVCVVVSSHILSEVQQICSSVLILQAGKLVKSFDLHEQNGAASCLELSVAATEEEILPALRSLPFIRRMEKLPPKEEGTVRLQLACGRAGEPGLITDRIFHLCAARDLPIREMFPVRDDLESTFIRAIQQ